MFFLCSSPPAPEPALNAIPPPPDERTERHLAMCQELAELGMQIARAVARKAMQDWTDEEPDPQPKAKKPDPALTFARLAGVVRQTIALETRLTEGPVARRPRERKFDPRRNTLKRLVEETTERNPDRNDLRKDANHVIEEHLTNEAHAETPMPDLFQSICREAGIEINVKTLSDEMLDLVCPGPWPPPRPPKPKPSFPQPSPHFDASGVIGKRPKPDAASANLAISGASRCSGMVGISS